MNTPTVEPTEEPTIEPTEELTPEPTEEPTVEPTEEPTSEPLCLGFAQYIVTASGVNNDLESLCQPDGKVAEIGQDSKSELILDMGVGNEIVDSEGGDLYFYEFPNAPGIHLDHVELAVASDDGNGHPDKFTVVFIWGDNIPDNNGNIPSKYLPEDPNRQISASDLHSGTGIGIDIGCDDETSYRFVRVRPYSSSAIQDGGKRAQVDAIEKASFDMNPTPTPEPTEEPTIEPTEEPTTEPTEEPTVEPTKEPTPEPTEEPTIEPTEEPTI